MNSTQSIAPVSIEKTSNNQGLILKEGDLFKIKCQADGNPIPKIDWFHNGTKIETNKYHDIRIEINGKLSTLIIGKVDLRHEGNYSCIAHNNNGLLSKWAYVTVVRKYSITTTPINMVAVNVCSQETCVHGSCINQNNISLCKCQSPYSGINCEYLPERNNYSEPCITFQNTKDYSITESKIFAFISFGLLIVLVLFLISILCFYKFKKRRSYIQGVKTRQLVNKSTQVSGTSYAHFDLPTIPDNISSSIINFENPKVNNYIYNDNSPYNPYIVQKDVRGPPSGQSCSSQETSIINNTLIPKTILVSVKENSYSLYNPSTINNNYCSTQLPPQMILLENTTPYLSSSSEPENNLPLNNYIRNVIHMPFSCDDPCCCLNIDSKSQLSSSFHSDVSKSALIHSNPLGSNHTCTCKCNIQSINTFV